MTVQSAAIKAAVAANAAAGKVIVTVNGRASNGVNFVIHGPEPGRRRISIIDGNEEMPKGQIRVTILIPSGFFALP